MESTNTDFCNICGKPLESSDEEICLRCWLKKEQENIDEEEIEKEEPIADNISDNTTLTNEKDKYRLKDLVWIIPFAILILIIVIVNVLGVVDVFSGFINIAKNVGNGNLILGICMVPFAIWGVVQIFRGFCEMCDTGKISSGWGMFTTILSFVALYFSISNL